MAVKLIAQASTLALAQLGELMNLGKDEPVGLQPGASRSSTTSPTV